MCRRPSLGYTNELMIGGKMLRFADLVERCERCNGAGRYTEVRSQSALMRSTYEGPCEVCGGVGGKITDQGRELQKFVQFLQSHHYPQG